MIRGNRVRMSIVRRGARAVKGLIDADSAAFIATYMVLKNDCNDG